MDDNNKKIIIGIAVFLIVLALALYFLLFSGKPKPPPILQAQSPKVEKKQEESLPEFIQRQDFYPEPGKELKAEYTVYRLKPEIKHGQYREFYKDGSKLVECNYKDGKLDGPLSSWFKKGQKALEGALKDGKKTGQFTEWHENGKKKFSYSFNDAGELDGAFIEFYDNEATMFEKTYSAGKLLPGTKYYKRDGTLKRSADSK